MSEEDCIAPKTRSNEIIYMELEHYNCDGRTKEHTPDELEGYKTWVGSLTDGQKREVCTEMLALLLNNNYSNWQIRLMSETWLAG